MREQDVGLELLLAWLEDEHGRAFQVEGRDEPAPGAVAATASDGQARLAVESHSLLEPTENDVWLAEKERLEGEIAAGLPGAYALWLPPGADLPRDGGEAGDLVRRAREKADALDPGERSHVALPVSVYLKKQQDDGALISASGGLNQYWARLSEKARGTYDLDSTRIHRLPESEEHLERLMETVWERAAGMEVGGWLEIETVDAWTVQRLRRGEGVTIVGRPPEELGDVGLTVRKNFRRLLAGAAPRLRRAGADVTALVVVGHYGRVEQEGATTAMRGYDPTLYAGLDFVCLAADGVIKALMEAPSGARR